MIIINIIIINDNEFNSEKALIRMHLAFTQLLKCVGNTTSKRRIVRQSLTLNRARFSSIAITRRSTRPLTELLYYRTVCLIRMGTFSARTLHDCGIGITAGGNQDRIMKRKQMEGRTTSICTTTDIWKQNLR